MKIDFPSHGQVTQLRQLWKTAFGDSDTFLDSFFETAFHPTRCRCVFDGSQLQAMLFWFDCEYLGKPMAYLYAIATHPNHRGKGLCRRLIEDTHRHLLRLGYAGSVLVPGTPELFYLYDKLGFLQLPGMLFWETAAGDSELPLRHIAAEEYAFLRRQLLPEGSVLQEKENLAFLQRQVQFYAGENLLFCARQEGDSLFVPELLGDPQTAPVLLKTLGCSRGAFRAPGGSTPFAMYHSLTEPAIPSWFGHAFD